MSRTEANDIIINKIWARNGSVTVIPFHLANCYVSSEFPSFTAIRNKLNPTWFYWFTKTKLCWQQCDEKSQGTSGKNRIKPEKFLQVEIPLPPLEEQQRIVAKVEELAGKIEECRGLRNEALRESDIILKSVSTHLLTEYKIGSKLEDILLNKPRNGWSARCDNLPTGTPILSLGAVTGFSYKSTEFKRTSEPVNPDGHYWLNINDLLITRSNTPELVGHAAIYNGSPHPCIYPDLMMRLDVDESKAIKKFVHFWLTCSLVREYITNNAKGTSPTMKKISQGVVMNIPFPSNVPIEKQQEIVTYLDNLQNKIKEMKQLREKAIQELDALLPGILDKAFKGEL